MEPRTYYKAGEQPITAVSMSAWALLEAEGWTQTPPEPDKILTDSGPEDDGDLPFATPLPKRRPGRQRKGDWGAL